MGQVTVKILNRELTREFWRSDTRADDAQKWLAEGQYRDVYQMKVTAQGERAAEVMYDFTNNPELDQARDALGYRGPAVNVGDIVNVEGVDFLCLPTGWLKIG